MNATNYLLMCADSDQRTLSDCLAICRAVEASPPESEVWTRAEAVKFGTQDALKDYYETRLDDPTNGLDESTGCLVAQIVSGYLEEINWGEMARHYRAKIKEGVTA